jgi:filamentous hemagglutinin family protein
LAQPIPDDTLGEERSEVIDRGSANFDIDGGARRGANLFHSFQEFNVAERGSVYFLNPSGIENILSRVTGSHPSNILGTLGVRGTANLFFINPNGILFGQNSRLDVGGSFVATTADAIGFGDRGFFSATNSEAPSQLLAIDPSAFFFNHLDSQPGTISSTGNLQTGQDLTLKAGNLDLQGQLFAGRNLTLHALDRLQIRDTTANPFIAAANDQLLIQGNQTIDIFALNHPNSGLFSGGDMVLRSSNQVGGDAHYWSGGNFRIEQLNGNLGDLYSPFDPIIRSIGDISFNNYLGASLHIIAGGAVRIGGTVLITEPETGSQNTDYIRETVQLSDGSEVAIDGGAQPTLDIRAGVDPSQIGISSVTGVDNDFFFDNFFNLEIPSFTATPTNADITVGNIALSSPNGLIFLTNQYKPNSSLGEGNITIAGNLSSGVLSTDSQLGNGGLIIIDSRNTISLVNSVEVIACSTRDCSLEGRGGDIRFLAEEDIVLNPFASVLTNGGGNVQIQSNRLLMEPFSQITSPVIGVESGGNILIQSSEAVRIDGGNIGTLTSSSQASGESGSITIKTGELTLIGMILPDDRFPEGFRTGGDITVDVAGESSAGDISIDAREVRVINGAQIRASTQNLGGVEGSGDAGNITIRASELVEVTGIILETDDPSKIETTVRQGTSGDGGDLLIETDRLIVSNGAQIQAGAFGAGQGGSLTVNATESVEIFDEVADDNPTGFFTGPEGSDGSGRGGDLTIRTGQLSLRDADSEISNEVDLEASGDAGDTFIEVDRLVIRDGARITAGTLGTGQGGTLTINATESVDVLGTGGEAGIDEEPSAIFIATIGFADAGNLVLRTNQLRIRDGATITASTVGLGEESLAGTGRGGNITIDASELIEVSGISGSGELTSNITSEAGRLFGVLNPFSAATGGTTTLRTGRLIVQDGAEVSTQTIGSGDAGNLIVDASESVQLTDGSLRTRTRGAGNAGSLNIRTGRLIVQGNSEAAASTNGEEGQGGNLTVVASNLIELSGQGGLGTLSNLGGDAGNIDIRTGRLVVRDGAGITTSAIGRGRAGSLNVVASDSIEVIGGEIVSGAEANARLGFDSFNPSEEIFLPSRITTASATLPENPAGDLSIQTERLFVQDGAEVSTSTLLDNPGGQLQINAELIEISGRAIDGSSSSISAQTLGAGNGGDIQINTQTLNILDGAELSASTSIGGRPSGTTLTTGRPGNITIENADAVFLSNGSISTAVEPNTIAISTASNQGGDIDIQTRQLTLTNRSEVTSATFGQGNAGNISVQDAQRVELSSGSSISTAVNEDAVGQGGNIDIQTEALNLSDRSQISAQSQGRGEAGDIQIEASERFTAINSDITTASTRSSGGDIDIEADRIQLYGDSDIRTNSRVDGGNIILSASSILAFDDSDIIAAAGNQGGNITLDTAAYFGENYQFDAVDQDPESLEGNDRADINATGAQPGVITTPDTTFIQNSLTELPDTAIDPDTLVANSCVVRSENGGNTFTITGTGGLPLRPGDRPLLPYSTSPVRSIPADANVDDDRSWQPGDAIVEPQGAYQLEDGRWVLSRECGQEE